RRARVTPAIRRTLTPDPLFPQRDILLDVNTVAQRLAARLGARAPLTMTHCARLRVKYHIGESLRVLHCIQAQGRWFVVAARMFPAGHSATAYQKAAAAAVPCGLLRPVLHDADLSTVFWTFPNDRKIANLPVLTHVPPTLQQPLGQPWRRSQVVAYAPEKSATARCLDDQRVIRAYAKVYAGQEGYAGYHAHHTLWCRLPAGDPHLRLPQALAYSAPHCTLLLEPAMGQRLIDLRGAALRHGLQCFGAALARLHALVPPELPSFTRLDLASLQQAAGLITQLRPDVGEAADALARQLTSTWEQPTEPPV